MIPELRRIDVPRVGRVWWMRLPWAWGGRELGPLEYGNNNQAPPPGLEQADSTRFPRSVRMQVPRMLMALYEIRNNRGVGHVGGDVNPNEMDATCTLHMSQWLMAELVRVFHNTTTDDAGRAVAALVERTIPSVWQVDGLFRILDTDLSMREETLLHLYRSTEPLTERDLVTWTEHSNASVYRRDVLRPLHRSRFIEYNEHERRVTLSPKGIAEASQFHR